ncbi:AbrB/MazE/SpoVT family DNA-binding domain-containing protein [Pelomonas aquatica]|jgi:AbrB family looped-hinge helix DNA binding protein|uniref:AbrB/MazE/SpoVT family DNA-binding domain-containing protein n=1 Tax=Pelomonas aquatica TaxID=431058 RepID=A0A9X4R6S2_9BURK|nr:AbrB/MazE/SpoVT family DNA-binding domain-containing protein [Pelomonas aquatica]MCY4756247.1 AbrB/MazE/SpoVT family DNA-binding domain-containing protein [Pelomonas aquatica]MDG0865125.1 AbrB/MazE/SpoVT family DNA-binding domain-containing protein [Pelomonas aquatica]
MTTAAVTLKGQVTIPVEIRRKLGLRQGSRVEFRVLEDRVELAVAHRPGDLNTQGFGMLKSKRKPVAADFDAAQLLRGSR